MVEFPDENERRTMLQRLVGIEEKVYLQVDGGNRIFPIADEDLERSSDEKTSAVHFLRFELSAGEASALKQGATLAAGIDHDNYNVETHTVRDNIRQSLVADLD